MDGQWSLATIKNGWSMVNSAQWWDGQYWLTMMGSG